MDYSKQFLKELDDLGDDEGMRRSEAMDVFLELAFLTLRSRTVPTVQFEANESEWEKAVSRLRKREASHDRIGKMLGMVLAAIGLNDQDFLGPIFMEISASSEMGQFFTPREVSRLMALLTINETVERIKAEGVISIHEPTCGVGGMVLSIAEVLREQGIDVERQVHFTLVDVDIRCVRAAFIQCCGAGISATIIHGNALSLEERSVTYTFAAIEFPKTVSGAPRVIRHQASNDDRLVEVLREALS